jgi:hypothetical protein
MMDSENRELNISNHRDRVFKALQGFSESRKRPALRKTLPRCLTGRTFLILDREGVTGERSDGLFSTNQGKSNGGEELFLFSGDFVLDRQ